MALGGGKLNFYEVNDENGYEPRFTINANNDRVGVNQVNPQYTLDVGGSFGANTIRLTHGNPHINFFESDTENQNWLIQANGGKLGFYSMDDNNSGHIQHVTFNDIGYVGINKTNPTSFLHVNGRTQIDGPTTATLRIEELDDANGKWAISASSGRLRFSVGDTTWGLEHKLSIRGANGFVGINNNSPSQQLHVNGNLQLENANVNLRFHETDRTSDGKWQVSAINGRYRIYSMNDDWTVRNDVFVLRHANGNLGLGTPSPSAKLHVMGDMRLEADNATMKFDETDQINGNWAVTANSGRFRIYQVGEDWSTSSYVDKFTIQGSNGNVGINNASPSAQLHVSGNIKATVFEEWPDYVFEESYELSSLKDVEEHIKAHGHLQDIPSAEEVKRDDIDLTSMDAKLLQKIEELTLYLIEQNKRIDELEQQLANKDN